MSLVNKNRGYFKHTDERLNQGDLFSDVVIFENVSENEGTITVEEKTLPYVVVMTQECDLEQDFKNRNSDKPPTQDKYLPSILLCPAYPAEPFRLGKHLEEGDGQKMESFNSEKFKQLKQNQLYRYHHIKPDIELNVPELIIDFKHYYTVAYKIAYTQSFRKKYIITVSQLFREDLSARFCFYLSRIGLPI